MQCSGGQPVGRLDAGVPSWEEAGPSPARARAQTEARAEPEAGPAPDRKWARPLPGRGRAQAEPSPDPGEKIKSWFRDPEIIENWPKSGELCGTGRDTGRDKTLVL